MGRYFKFQFMALYLDRQVNGGPKQVDMKTGKPCEIVFDKV